MAQDACIPDSRSLATSLAPVLREACEQRLGEINWFKADWQRGGAATGVAAYTEPEGEQTRVVIKLPVVQRELLWTRRLQREDEPPRVPKLFASGQSLGGYDLAWVVIEWFPHGPLGTRWHEDHTPRIAEAAACFYTVASSYPVDQAPKDEPWDELLRDAQRSLKINTGKN